MLRFYKKHTRKSACIASTCAMKALIICGSTYDLVRTAQITGIGPLVVFPAYHLKYILINLIGNAWAAAGMIRVLGTIQRSQYAESLGQQQQDLAHWIQEIHDGMYPHQVRSLTSNQGRLPPLTVDRFPQDSSGLFHNYADEPFTFLDASSTALLASTVYRLSLLWGVHTHLPHAELSRKSLSSSAGISGWRHFTNDGWLKPVVDPYAYPYQGQDSPEGQAFVIAMQAAWRDWVADGARGASGSPRSMDLNAYVLLASFIVFYVRTLALLTSL